LRLIQIKRVAGTAGSGGKNVSGFQSDNQYRWQRQSAKVDLNQCIRTPLAHREEKATAPTVSAK